MLVVNKEFFYTNKNLKIVVVVVFFFHFFLLKNVGSYSANKRVKLLAEVWFQQHHLVPGLPGNCH